MGGARGGGLRALSSFEASFDTGEPIELSVCSACSESVRAGHAQTLCDTCRRTARERAGACTVLTCRIYRVELPRVFPVSQRSHFHTPTHQCSHALPRPRQPLCVLHLRPPLGLALHPRVQEHLVQGHLLLVPLAHPRANRPTPQQLLQQEGQRWQRMGTRVPGVRWPWAQDGGRRLLHAQQRWRHVCVCPRQL